MPTTEPWTREEKDFSIFAELEKHDIEKAKMLVAGLMSDKEWSTVKWLETRILRNRILETIRYVFDDQVVEITLKGIYLQWLGDRSPNLKVDFSDPSTILVFRNHLKEISPEPRKSAE